MMRYAALVMAIGWVAATAAAATPTVNVSLSVSDPALSVGQRATVSVLAEVLNYASPLDGLFSYDFNVNFSAAGLLSIDAASLTQPGAESPLSQGTLSATGLACCYGTFFYHQDYGLGAPKELVRFAVDALAPGGLTLSVTGDATIGADFLLQESPSLAVNYGAASQSVSVAARADRTWNVDAGGPMAADANWTGGVAPNAVGDVAIFGPKITANRIAAVDTPTTLGTLEFDDDNNYTIQGAATLTLQAAGAAHAHVLVDNAHGNGAHTIGAPLAVASDLDVAQASSGALTLLGPLNNAEGRSLTKTGAGMLVVSGPQVHGLGALLDILAGTVCLNTDAGNQGANLSASVTGAELRFGASQHLDTLAVGNGGKVVFAGAGGVVLKHLANAGAIDMTTGSLVVDYDGPSPLADVRAMLASGCAGGTWDGPGIASSTAAADPDGLTAVGVLDNTHPKVGGKTTFEGDPVDATAVLVKFTWGGDANLDGAVDANDYDVIDVNYLFPPAPANTGWWTGDFTYDGVIDANDYDRIDRAYLFQTGPLAGGAAAAPAATPEPATLALLCLGAVAAVAARGRRK